MLTDIYLYGELGKRFGTHWELGVDSPAEAVRALERIKPGFMQAILDLSAVVEGFQVDVGDRNIGEELLMFPTNGKRITITPVVQGSDSKSVLQIIAGVALIAVGVALMFVPGAQPGAAPILYAGFTAAQWGVQIALLGAAIALGGIAQLLMTTPSLGSTDEKKQKQTYTFSGIVNTAGQGSAVPILFGEMIVGSQVVSAGLESKDTDATGGKNNPGGHHGIGHQPPIPV